ncbi:MAG: hypothetical protein RBS05_17455 [Zoogloea oleivorans]|jgi:uracil-DNA glycosylase|uniref:hypothetical protein n=1 Tax=Zoogloea oleivorans TaxID=1552750 RepID=UPI002A3683EB|nr:hypothetical protein [Zoogloea oleivorans]MDY0037700.1 hypothetical protein [Zoogloea oleivorans]
MATFTPHYCEGRIPVAFVFSAPGNDEVIFGRPVAGTTGENLDKALVFLRELAPNFFPSSSRYDYRITNAFPDPRARSIGNGRTEPTRSEVLTNSNIQRFLKDIDGCSLVVLCGKKAGYLSLELEQKNILIVQAVHVGNKGLNGKFKLLSDLQELTPTDRRHQRTRLWAEQLLTDINCLCGTAC